EAKRLLDAAGVRDFKDQFSYTGALGAQWWLTNFATLMAESLAQIGVMFTLNPVAQPQTLYEDWLKGNFGIGQSIQTPSGEDPDELLVPYFSSGGARNYAKWENAKFDELLKKQSTLMDVKER